MATAPLRAESAHVITPSQFPPAAAARVAQRMLARFNRDELGIAIEVLVELFDVWDGDPEAEITDAEDDFADHGQRPWHGPGCTISDPAEHDDDDHEHDGRERDDGV